MLVLTARRAAKAATLVRSRMDPRDTSTLRTCGCRPAGNHQDSPPDVPGKSRALPTGPPKPSESGQKPVNLDLNCPLQASGKKAVEAGQLRLGVRPMARQGAQV